MTQTQRDPLPPVADDQLDRTLRILKARRDVLTDSELSDGARALFCFLLDLSLLKSVNERDGVIAISVLKLAFWLKRSRRAISDWKNELRQANAIWTSVKALPGHWPLDVCHVTALDARGTVPQATTSEGTWGSGASQARPETGAKAPVRGQSLPAEFAGSVLGDLQNAPENATGASTKVHGPEQTMPAPGAQFATGASTKVSGREHSLPRARANYATGASIKVSGREHKGIRARAKSARLRESPAVKESGSAKAVNRLGNRAGAAGAGKVTHDEMDFIATATEVLGEPEMNENGGGWRSYYREHRNRAWAVIQETRTVLKERPASIKTSAAKYAMDLWKRFKQSR